MTIAVTAAWTAHIVMTFTSVGTFMPQLLGPLMQQVLQIVEDVGTASIYALAQAVRTSTYVRTSHAARSATAIGTVKAVSNDIAICSSHSTIALRQIRL